MRSLLIVVLACISLGCAKEPNQVQSSALPDSSEAVIVRSPAKELIQAEFNDILADCISQGSYERQLGSTHYGLQKALGELSHAERLFVDGWVTPERDAGNSLVGTLHGAREFLAANGRLPENGAELASWYLSTLPAPIGPEGVQSMSPAELLAHTSLAVNVLTGHYFTTYTSSEWVRGGLYLRPADELEFAQVQAYRDLSPLNPPLAEMWMLRVYGDSPGEVLADQRLQVLAQRPW